MGKILKPNLGTGRIKHKLFKDIKEGEFIYYINPIVQMNNPKVAFEQLLKPTLDGQNQLIQAAKVLWVRGIPNAPALSRFVDIDYVRPEPLLHSTDINQIRRVTLRFAGDRNFWITAVNVENMGMTPVPYCTEREYLVAYIRTEYGR